MVTRLHQKVQQESLSADRLASEQAEASLWGEERSDEYEEDSEGASSGNASKR